jgi:hypothetical protein
MPRGTSAGVLRELVRLGRPWTHRLAFHLAMDWNYTAELFRRSPDPVVQKKLVFLNPDLGVTSASVHASLLTKLGNLGTYAALAEQARGEFSIGQLIRSDVIAVLGSDFRFSHILGPMNALMMKVLRQMLLTQGDDLEGKRATYLFIDEFPKLNYNAPAEDFADFCELGRSMSVHVVICMQTPEQVKKLYGPEDMASILGNCLNKLVFHVSDEEGAATCSKMLPHFHGYEWIRNADGTRSRRDHFTTYNYGEQRVDRPLVPPDVLQQLPLADWGMGWRGYGLDANLRRVAAWEDFISPEFLAATLGPDVARELIEQEHADLLLPYEQCRRSAEEQYLTELRRDEVESLGLTFSPQVHRPLDTK